MNDDTYLPLMPDTALQAALQPGLDDILSRLTQAPDLDIHSMYVYGSVARGNARPGLSDLDLCVIFTSPPDAATHETLQQLQQAAQLAHPCFSKVDIDSGCLQDLQAADTRLAWHYWLKHHCRHVYGPDLRPALPRLKPSLAIAIAVNGDFYAVLSAYAARIQAADNARHREKLIREAARKLIRASNILRQPDERDWPGTLEEHVHLFCRHYPERAPQMAYFLEQTCQPAATAETFTAQLEQMMDWMQATYRSNLSKP